MMQVILDVSRLLACARRQTPSGIDRVELAYTRRWLESPENACVFVAQDLRGGFALLPRPLVAELALTLDGAWTGGPQAAAAARQASGLALRARARLLLGRGRGGLGRVLANGRRSAFLLVSHRALEKQAPIAALRQAGAAFVPLIHDIIPVTHPEYARPGQAEKHRARMRSTGALADGVIVNSEATAQALRPWLRDRPQSGPQAVPVLVAPLGIDIGPQPAAPPAGGAADPYFVMLGTIEPRKNHLLLLHLWRDMASGPATPRLVIVGKRGWENENVVDILERCTALEGIVREAGQLPDREVTAQLRGARALLFPSFAEGYGLPLAEALALGVPAVCSDLPALREVGGTVPDYLDPLDGAAWREAVLDYARPDSPRRLAQLARLRGWRAPGWEEHFALVDGLLARVTTAAARGRPAARALPAAGPGSNTSSNAGPASGPGSSRAGLAARAPHDPAGHVAVRDAAVS